MWEARMVKGSKKNLIASLDQSLMRMGIDYVDIFYSGLIPTHLLKKQWMP